MTTDSAATPAAEVDATLSQIAGPLLAASNFRPATRRRWVRSYSPIRHVFEVGAMKGGVFMPRWGVSFDFVPHVKGNALAWHRTEKSAMLDLVYDPVDFDAEWQRHWAMDSLHGPDGLRRDARRVLPLAVGKACAWLDGITDLTSALRRAEWLQTADRPGRRFAFVNHVQQPLAYAFLLARGGSPDAARDVLDRWVAFNDVEHLRDELTALLTAERVQASSRRRRPRRASSGAAATAARRRRP